MTDVEFERTAAMAAEARRRRRVTKHGALMAAAIAMPIVLVVTGLVLVFTNVGDNRTPARPAIPQTRAQPGATAAVTAAAGPIPSAVPNVDPQQQALAVAQELATNFARHDYPAARAMSESLLDDSALAKQYQSVTKLTVVPVDIAPIGPSRYAMRLALVSQQSSQNIPTTVFYCVEWQVDAVANTIVQGGSKALQSIPGQADAGQYPQLVPVCHSAILS